MMLNQSSPLKFRPAQPEDVPAIAKIVSSSATWYEDFVEPNDMDQHKVDEQWAKRNIKKRDFYIAQDKNGNIVGTISFQYFNDVVYLGYVYLKTDYVGKGYGQHFLRFARFKSSTMRKKSMILIAHPKAKWATKAYEKFGFEKYLTEKDKILEYKDGLLEKYYEEGFHLYRYDL